MIDSWVDWEIKWYQAGSPKTLVEWMQEERGERLSPAEMSDFMMWAVRNFSADH